MFASGKFVVRFQLGHVRVGGAGRKANSSLELIVQASQVIKFMLHLGWFWKLNSCSAFMLLLLLLLVYSV